MIKIIHIVGDANYSGAPAHVLKLATSLNKKEFQSFAIGPAGVMVTQFEGQGISYYQVDLTSKFNFNAIGHIRSLIRRISSEKLSTELSTESVGTIIHCHGVRAGWLGRLAARGLNLPVIYTEHSWNMDYYLANPINQWLQLAILRCLDGSTDKTVAVSQSVVDFLVNHRITGKEKIIKIYHGIEQPKGILPVNDSLIIGSVGSLTWQKNYRWLIGLMPIIREKVPHVALEIIGDGPEKTALEQQVHKLGLNDAVRFIGSVDQKDLVEHYKKWGLYIQPSLNESFGLAIAEAIAAGLPALGADVGALPEIIGTKEGLFTLDNKEKAAAMIVDYLKDESKRRQLRDLELAHIKSFTIEKMITAYEALYRDLASSRKS